MPARASSSFSYDVFLSFAGKDTRTRFVGYLYHFLEKRKFRTFIDEREIQKGDQITLALPEAIGKSRIFIIVFSENYADSSFCLDELVKILHECTKGKGRLVLPVFYYVNPCDLRRQTGSFGKALAKHEERFRADLKNLDNNMKRLEEWKVALNQAADIYGWHFHHRDPCEFECLRTLSIVKEVSRHVACFRTIGLKSRVRKVNLLLNVGSDDGVHMIGICGVDGMGKTTVARGVYDFNAHQFEALCFLDNVSEISIRHGLIHLQEMLLSEIFGGKDIKLGSVNEGISMIKRMLHQKKVLLILDDVDRLKQLQAIVGQTDWFGSGSRVIITTQHKCLLTSHRVERIYDVDGLNKTEAFELLSLKAFEDGKVEPSYVDTLDRAVLYASGSPLALEVMGSNLCGKRIEECESALDQYAGIPHKEIQKILKVSFDALNKNQQEILITIMRYFKGHELAKVEDVLHRLYHDHLKDDIRVLLDKSLIKINEHGHVTLHDLTQDMIRDIVRLEDPGKDSRLHSYGNIVQVLEDNTECGKREFQPASNERRCELGCQVSTYPEQGFSHNQSASSDMRGRDPWQLWLCASISLVVSLCSSSSLDAP